MKIVIRRMVKTIGVLTSNEKYRRGYQIIFSNLSTTNIVRLKALRSYRRASIEILKNSRRCTIRRSDKVKQYGEYTGGLGQCASVTGA